MNPRKLVWQVKFGIYKVRFFSAFLGACTVFLACYLLLMLLAITPLLISLMVGALFFTTEMVVLSKKGALLSVEEKYDDVNEELRTVNDTLEKNNELVDELRNEVRIKVKKHVDMGDFIDFKKTLSRVLYIFFLSFAIILFASLNVKVPGIEKMIDLGGDFMLDLRAKIGQDAELQVVNSKNDLLMRFNKLAMTVGVNAGEQTGGDIFGSSEAIQLGNEKINIEIKPTDFEVSVEDFKPAEQKNFLEKPFEDDVFAEQSPGFEENIPQKRQEIVRRYFKKLAES